MSIENYPKQDSESLGEWYMRHVEAMTSEKLYSKSDIAAQLAWRDKKIAELQHNLAIADRTIEELRNHLAAE